MAKVCPQPTLIEANRISTGKKIPCAGDFFGAKMDAGLR